MKKAEFNNPFIWSVVFADDMIRLVEDWDKIDFKNYEMVRMTNKIALENNYDRFNNTMTGFLIDNKIQVFYTHYLYGNYTTPTKIGPDILYNKNFEYAYTKFEIRLKRMLNISEQPIFVIFTYKRHGWSIEKVKKLLSVNTNYKTIIITDMDVKSTKDNFRIIKMDKLDTNYKFPLSAIKFKKEEVFKELGI